MLRVEHIAKRFGPVTALRDVNLHLKKGEVLGLLGDNGAGKSTLIKIISGFQKQDTGQMFLHGQPYEPKSVDDARAKGIDTVYQDLALIDELSVYHNLFLRRERVFRPLPLLNNREMKREARTALDEIGINIPRIDVAVARLSGGQRQAIAVARTVNADADIILLDEPLAAMGAKEGAQILDLVARLKEEGNVSIIMILHNYVHVLAGVRPREHDPGRRDRARQADVRDLGRGAHRHRRQRVPPRARRSAREERPAGAGGQAQRGRLTAAGRRSPAPRSARLVARQRLDVRLQGDPAVLANRYTSDDRESRQRSRPHEQMSAPTMAPPPVAPRRRVAAGCRSSPRSRPSRSCCWPSAMLPLRPLAPRRDRQGRDDRRRDRRRPERGGGAREDRARADRAAEPAGDRSLGLAALDAQRAPGRR